MKTNVEAVPWTTEPESLPLRVSERFGCFHPLRRMPDQVRGLLGPVCGKHRRQIAEHTGHATPYGLRRLPSWCR
ncbi:hypothetical protein [Streptosporangium sp. 'caverna']|uniref:hypothetical protein n=1 Tax=Streptosporangium sp. 'caverna' TaxID=2202249 RepID=UPI000D7E4568|nr:hypothetical protein [Streptosporangium sp. 'caverna']AWS47144.1 hypothetical protein DKM19_43445 [Streptosporangium sp. 'caverna']